MLDLQRVQRSSAADEVYEQLVAGIVAGDVSAGDTMPSERALSDALGVSRPVVREAMQRLSHAGLVEVRHGGSTRVADYRRTAGPDLLRELLVDDAGEIDLAVARDVVRARADIGPPLVADAARRATTADHEALDEIVLRMRGTDDVGELQHLALGFFDRLVDAADNVVHRLLFNVLRRAYEPVMDALAVVLRDEVSDVDGYAAIAAAVRAGNPTAAAAAVHDVVDRGTRATVEAIDALLATPDHES